MNREQVAVEILKCAIAHEPDSCLLGNVRAADIAALAAAVIDTCPKCGATAWVNIDCDLCTMCHALGVGEAAAPKASLDPDTATEFREMYRKQGRQEAVEACAQLCEAEGRARLGAMDSVANLCAGLARRMRSARRPGADDIAKGLDDHALAGMLGYLANAIERGVSPVVDEDLSRNVREARNRARWLRERAETSGAGTSREQNDDLRSSTPGGGSEEPGTLYGQTRTTDTTTTNHDGDDEDGEGLQRRGREVFADDDSASPEGRGHVRDGVSRGSQSRGKEVGDGHLERAEGGDREVQEVAHGPGAQGGRRNVDPTGVASREAAPPHPSAPSSCEERGSK